MKNKELKNRPIHSEISTWFINQGYEPIEPLEFYRNMFPAGELASFSKDPKSDEANAEWKYNAILLENTHKTKNTTKTDPRTGKKVPSTREVWKKHIVLDDLSQIEKAVSKFGKTNSEYFISPISYLGRQRTQETERWYYACIIDIDYPKTEGRGKNKEYTGLEQLVWDWTGSSIPYLMPSACVSSGNGLHLVYFLDRPYCLTQPSVPTNTYMKSQWDCFRRIFTDRVWTKYVTKETKQYQSHCQVFRLVGSRTKQGQLVEAFWLSKKRYSLEELFYQFPHELRHYKGFETEEEMKAYFSLHTYEELESGSLYYPDEEMLQHKYPMPKGSAKLTPRLQEMKEKFPEWYESRIVRKEPKKVPGKWKIHRGLYDWYFQKAKEKAYVGCRYHRIHALAQYAAKCEEVTYDEFCNDAAELYKIYTEIDTKNPFHYLEYIKARDEYFNSLSYKSTAKWVKTHCGIVMNPPAKRNHRTRQEHLWATIIKNSKGRPQRNACYDNREMTLQYMRENGEITGRPVGSGTKQQLVKQWRAEHPDGIKADCIRDTGFSKHTVYKWWDEKLIP